MSTYVQNERLRPDGTVPNDRVFRDLLENIEANVRGMWRFRWRAVLLMWIVTVFGWIAVSLLPPVYQADARIFVDTDNVLDPLLDGIALSTDVMSEVTIVTRELLSRPNLTEVAQRTGLRSPAMDDQQFQDLLYSLQSRIQVAGNRENIFSITFRDEDRNRAVAVVEELVTIFVDKSLHADRAEAQNAQSFLKRQIEEYEGRLTEAEDKLSDFKRQNVAVMPDQRGDYFARLQAATSALIATQEKLGLAQQRRLELVRQLEGEDPVFGIVSVVGDGSDGEVTASSAKIRNLEAQLEELQLQYTDRHPRIRQIVENIELLKKQEQQERSLDTNTTGVNVGQFAGNLERNPVYQNMRIQLTNADVEIATLQTQVRQQRGLVNELTALVDTVPQVEAQLSRLNRDYDVVRSKYEQLLAQLETASIGQEAEANIDNVQFRIIEPPFAEIQPVGPQRNLFLLAVLIAAFGTGIVIAFLLNKLHPVFYSSRKLSSATGLPVLGAVSLLVSPSGRNENRVRHIKFVATLATLVVSSMLFAFFAQEISPIIRDLWELMPI